MEATAAAADFQTARMSSEGQQEWSGCLYTITADD